jgi:hypothetical protein
VKSFVQKLDAVPVRTLLAINGVGSLVYGFGPSLTVRLFTFPSAVVAEMRWLTLGLLACGLVAVPAAAIGMIWRRAEHPCFAAQALALFALGVLLFVWAVSIVIHGTPAGIGFSWSPGILSFVVGYGVYLLRRAFAEHHLAKVSSLFYAHLIAVAIVVPFDIAVAIRVVHDFMFRHKAA